MADPTDILGGFTGIDFGGIGVNILGWIIASVFFLGAAYLLYKQQRDKKIYKDPVTIMILKENGLFKEITNLRGGIITKKRTGVSDYEIRVPRQRKKRRLGYIPNLELADIDGRLTFVSRGDGKILEQCKKTLIKDKQIKIKVEENGKLVDKIINYELLVEPIPNDVKTLTINNLMEMDKVTDQDKITALKLTIGGILILALIQIIFIFVTAQKG